MANFEVYGFLILFITIKVSFVSLYKSNMPLEAVKKKWFIASLNYAYIHNHIRTVLDFHMACKSVCQNVCDICSGDMQPKNRTSPPSHTRPLPPVLNNGPAKALNIP